MTKERPLLFSAAMVKAVLEGRKTQTRRVVKLPKERGEWEPITVGGPGVFTSSGEPAPRLACIWNTLHGRCIACPYGQPGDRLWVKETLHCEFTTEDDDTPNGCMVVYSADGIPVDRDGKPACWEWQRMTLPSIHMPRWASRITLELTDVRVERLQSISEADAEAEGIKQEWTCICPGAGGYAHDNDVIDDFRTLWDSINGLGSWNANPWVWALAFRRVEG